MSIEEVIPEFLNKEEIQSISSKKIKIKRLRQVRDVFLFCCFTGLAYVYIKKLNAFEVPVEVDNELWVQVLRARFGK